MQIFYAQMQFLVLLLVSDINTTCGYVIDSCRAMVSAAFLLEKLNASLSKIRFNLY